MGLGKERDWWDPEFVDWPPRGALSAIAIGGAIALSSGSAPAASSHLQIDSVSCLETSAPGHPAHGACTYLLTDGRRFKCPLRFSERRQTPTSLERARACRPLRPFHIPAAWKPVFTHLYAVQACLARKGVSTSGGPFLEGPRPRTRPIGELITKTRPTAFIAFYTTARVAKRAEPQVLASARRIGGRVQRRGAVTVLWTKPPAARQRATAEACAFA
jgi:hypothetical protein